MLRRAAYGWSAGRALLALGVAVLAGACAGGSCTGDPSPVFSFDASGIGRPIDPVDAGVFSPDAGSTTPPCMPDRGEPNDTILDHRPYPLTMVSSGVHLPPPYDLPPAVDESDFSLGSATDVDWLSYSGGPLNPSPYLPDPALRIRLDAIPDGADYDLSAWTVCLSNSTVADAGCAEGEPEVPLPAPTSSRPVDAGVIDEPGCRSASRGSGPEEVALTGTCASADSTLFVWIRVTSFRWQPICEPYRIRVQVCPTGDEEGADTAADAIPVTPVPPHGTLVFAGWIDRPGDVDWYVARNDDPRVTAVDLVPATLDVPTSDVLTPERNAVFVCDSGGDGLDCSGFDGPTTVDLGDGEPPHQGCHQSGVSPSASVPEPSARASIHCPGGDNRGRLFIEVSTSLDFGCERSDTEIDFEGGTDGGVPSADGGGVADAGGLATDGGGVVGEGGAGPSDGGVPSLDGGG